MNKNKATIRRRTRLKLIGYGYFAIKGSGEFYLIKNPAMYHHPNAFPIYGKFAPEDINKFLNKKGE
jgi:hypothetical protein